MALLDQNLMHQRNLPGRAAKAQQSDLEPDAERFAEAWRRLRVPIFRHLALQTTHWLTIGG